jgi:hypothetical protein
VSVTTLNIPISDGADDGDGTTTSINIANTQTSVIDAVTESIVLRFRNVTIPSGATINSASISVVPISSLNDEPDHPIVGFAHDNAPVFTTGENITLRAVTSASVTWTSADLGADGTLRFSSPNLASIVQEIVDRPGWSSGNAMGFRITGSADSTRDLAIFMFNGGVKFAEFDVDYTAGGALTREQEGYRWRNDDGSETTATWVANQDTDITFASNTVVRLRILTNVTGDAPSEAVRLQARKVGETDWWDVT